MALPQPLHTATAESSQEELLNASANSTTAPRPHSAVAMPGPSVAEPIFTDHPHFKLSIETLQELTDNRNSTMLQQLGDVDGLAKHLRTDMTRGLCFEEDLGNSQAFTSKKDHDILPDDHPVTAFVSRRDAYGTNFIPPSPPPSLLSLMWEALQDRTLKILGVVAIVSIAVGVYQRYKTEEKNNWIEGVAILFTVLFVVAVNATNDYRKALQFRFLSAQKHATSLITVTRHSTDAEPAQTTIPIIHILVGDIVHLNTGDIVPADGVFISGHNCKVDESSVTGETDAVTKALQKDRFMISGSKVIDGIATYMVTTAGKHSLHGRSVLALRSSSPLTPLQLKLGDLAESIANFGLGAAVCLVVVSLIIFLAKHAPGGFEGMSGSDIASRILNIFITGITVVVVAVPEGLPMAVTMALGFATIRMLKDNNLVRVLAACETMGGATTICSDKTGTLTQNKMTVVKGTLFKDMTFETVEQIRPGVMAPGTANDQLRAALFILSQACNINSTAYEGKDDKGKREFVGSKTECALLEFTAMLDSVFAEDRAAAEIVSLLPFSSERKRMSTVIRKATSKNPDISFDLDLPPAADLEQEGLVAGPDGESRPPVRGDARCFVKGASEYILQSSEYYVTGDGSVAAITPEIRSYFTKRINSYATNALRTIGIAYKDVPAVAEPPNNLDTYNLIFLGLVGIEDPLRAEVPPAVEKCQNAGIVVRMVTGDNAITAENIARRCGILARGGIVMEGPKFRMLSDSEMRKTIPRLRVLARSSPLDKRVLVNKLKEMGETVAVTGDGTNDGPALKAADVGFAMGIAGTEVAKEASDIILMDDNFASLTKAVMWGRSVYDAVRKFLQFQLTVNIAAVALALISSLGGSEQESVISAVQLLWVNLIMDTLAALALATDPPTPALLDRKPHRRSDPIISYDMWKQLLGQAIFQIAVTCTLTFAGPKLFGIERDTVMANPTQFGLDANAKAIDKENYAAYRLSAIVFNAFVFMQIANLFNGRAIHGEYNVFKNVFKNPLFVGITLFIIVGQVIIIFVGGDVFKVRPISGVEWAVTVLLGLVSLPGGALLKALPDVGRKWFQKKYYVADPSQAKMQWQYALKQVQTQVAVVRVWRGYRGEREGVVVME
ncbi:plasma membrane calcium [Sorochytrium milnesiophthora]